MYNPKDIQFVGKHDYDKEASERMASIPSYNTFSVGIFKWELKNNGKAMKKGKILVRVSSEVSNKENVFKYAEQVVSFLDSGRWDGRKTVKLNPELL